MNHRKNSSNSGSVYSSDHGYMCPSCDQPLDRCVCRGGASPTGASTDGIVRVSRQTKGRKGKGVTLITGVPLRSEQLDRLAKELKSRCGAGGTVKAGVIEIQGEHRDVLVQELQKRGYQAKRAGG